MYVTTFYSFKGGVGRTMALVNVATELAQRGRRVLVVDFDLEAPGLDTYDLPVPKQEVSGIVEFVEGYLATGQAPNAGEYIYETPEIGKQDGGLWIMPAGINDATYGERLGRINWGDLYEKNDGYLLFEDLKEQWRQLIDPDYVLIDSRTGHTDTSGICTRQLPDAVVVQFFPNTQNLRGLKKFVSDVRAEAKPPRNKNIKLHFVMSNVPDLDDEDRILAQRIQQFRLELRFKSFSQVIHRYDSLSLLNQSVFTKDRPNSRLAKEYRRLADKIVEANPEDREAALAFLRGLFEPMPFALDSSPQEVTDRLDKIRKQHFTDGEILHYLGMFKVLEREFTEASTLLGEAVKAGHKTADTFLALSDCLRELDDSSWPRSVLEAFKTSDANPYQLDRAIKSLRRSPDRGWLRTLTDGPALANQAVSNRIWVASRLATDRAELGAAKEILLAVLAEPRLDVDDQRSATQALGLVLIGLGQFSEALGLLAPASNDPATMTMQTAFNYGMAEWGARGSPAKSYFARVAEVYEREPASEANVAQCLSVAYAILDRKDDALRLLSVSRNAIAAQGREEFSCWRYLLVRPKEFLADLSSIESMIEGDIARPAFMNGDPAND